MPVTPYLGNFATRCCIQSATLAAGTATQVLSKTRHIARATVSSFRVAFPNWYVSTSTFQELGNGGTATITAAIEYPIGGRITPIKWSGSASVSVASASQTELSDPIEINILDGHDFIIRCFYQNSSGVLVYQGSGNTQDATNGEQFRFSTGALTDQTLRPGAFTGGSSSANLGYGPILIVGMIDKPSVFLVGDSRTQGINDTYAGNSSSDKGQTARSVGPSFGYINIGIASMTAGSFIAAHTKQLALADYCTHIISAMGINDIQTSNQTPATVSGRITTIASYFPGKKFYQTTLTPETTSTDTWITTVNQTPLSENADRIAFNDLVRAGISGVTGYFEVADVAEGTRDSGTWIVDGNANYATSDGIHESQAMNLVIQSSQAINTGLISLPSIDKSSNVRNIGSRLSDNGLVGGYEKLWMDTYNFSSAIPSGTTIDIAVIPKNSTVTSIDILFPSLSTGASGTGTTISIGVRNNATTTGSTLFLNAGEASSGITRLEANSVTGLSSQMTGSTNRIYLQFGRIDTTTTAGTIFTVVRYT